VNAYQGTIRRPIHAPAAATGGFMGSGNEHDRSVYHALVERIEAHALLFEKLHSLSQQQSGLIDCEDTDRLLGVLGERQAVIDELEKSRRALEPLRSQWEASLSRMESGWRADVAARLEAITQLAGAISRRDEHDRERLSTARGKVVSELASLSVARRASGAYGGTSGKPGAKYQDREV
jgi:hypothetical protein